MRLHRSSHLGVVGASTLRSSTEQAVDGPLDIVVILFERSHRLGPAETHTAQCFDSLDVVFGGWCRIVCWGLFDYVRLGQVRRQRVVFRFLPPERQADL